MTNWCINYHNFNFLHKEVDMKKPIEHNITRKILYRIDLRWFEKLYKSHSFSIYKNSQESFFINGFIFFLQVVILSPMVLGMCASYQCLLKTCKYETLLYCTNISKNSYFLDVLTSCREFVSSNYCKFGWYRVRNIKIVSFNICFSEIFLKKK